MQRRYVTPNTRGAIFRCSRAFTRVAVCTHVGLTTPDWESLRRGRGVWASGARHSISSRVRSEIHLAGVRELLNFRGVACRLSILTLRYVGTTIPTESLRYRLDGEGKPIAACWTQTSALLSHHLRLLGLSKQPRRRSAPRFIARSNSVCKSSPGTAEPRAQGLRANEKAAEASW